MPCWPLKVGQALHRGVEVALSSFVVKLYLSCIEMDSNVSLTEPRIACLKLVELLNCEEVYEFITGLAIIK